MRKILVALLIAILSLVAVVYFLKPVTDLDLFWHMANGRWIVQNKALPASDPFSYTTPSDNVNVHAVLTRYWISQALFYCSYAVAGWNGIVLVRFPIFALIVYFIYRRKGEADLGAFLFFLLLATVTMLRGFPLERPHVFTFLFFAILLFLLDDILKSGEEGDERLFTPKLLYPPLLMIIWANAHVGFIVIQVIIATYIVTEGLKLIHPVFGAHRGKLRYKRLVISGVGAILASFANPNTFRGFGHYFYQESIFPVILDWQSTIETFQSIFTPQLILYWAVLGFCALVVLYKLIRREQDITEIAMLAGLGYYSFNTIKFVPLFLIYAVPLAALAFRKGSRSTLKAAISLGCSLVIAAYFLVGQGDAAQLRNVSNFKEGRWLPQTFPDGAVEFVRQNDLRGNMFNNFDWGGYLVWMLGPEKKVFIDNRILDNRVFYHAMSIDNAVMEPEIVGKPHFKALLDSYRVNYIITKLYNTRVQMLPLTARLIYDTDWVPVYQQANSVVFMRNIPANEHLIKKYAHVRYEIIDYQIGNLRGMVENFPGHSSLYILMGELYLLKNDVEGAKGAFRKALEVDPKQPDALRRMGELGGH
jgi:hypothetical protein